MVVILLCLIDVTLFSNDNILVKCAQDLSLSRRNRCIHYNKIGISDIRLMIAKSQTIFTETINTSFHQ